MKEGKRVCFMLRFSAILVGLFFLGTLPAHATYAKFDIPGDFPGNFRIDFLGTDFKLSGGPGGGSLSTESTIDFSVGSGSGGVYDISASPQDFQFIGFEVMFLDFDVYGAGSGSGSFDTNTGDWYLEMPTLFVNGDNGHATKLDMFFSTQNIEIPASGSYPAYWTTTATPMILDDNNANWGDLNLVAGGLVQAEADLTLLYDEGLIASILAGYSDGFGGPALGVDNEAFRGIQYEFDIYGNDPLAVPEPSSVLLIATGLAGLVRLKRLRK